MNRNESPQIPVSLQTWTHSTGEKTLTQSKVTDFCTQLTNIMNLVHVSILERKEHDDDE